MNVQHSAQCVFSSLNTGTFSNTYHGKRSSKSNDTFDLDWANEHVQKSDRLVPLNDSLEGIIGNVTCSCSVVVFSQDSIPAYFSFYVNMVSLST
jgi:hypothetical protein